MSDSSVAAVGTVERVLVVGNSDRTAAAVTTLAEAFGGPSVLLESTTTAALDRLGRVDVDCLVCDAGESIRSVIDAIRTDEHTRGRERGDVPIVAIASAEEANAALENGATDVIAPDDPAAVVGTRVRNAVERAELRSSRARPTDSDSDARYRSLLEHSGVPVLVLDERATIRYASPGVESTTGYTPDELERRDVSRVVHPDDRDDALEAVADLADEPLGTTRRSTYRMARADGTWRVATLSFTNRLEDPAVGGILCTVVEGPAAGRSSADSTGPTGSAEPTASIDRLAYPFFALDENWALTDCNDAARRLFESGRSDADGSTPSTLLGTVVWELVPESVRGTFSERVREATATDSVVEFATTFPSLESTFEFHVHPGESGVSIYGRDAGSTGARTRTLRDRSRLFEAVVETLEDGVFVIDADGTIELANAASYELFEIDGETLVGRHLETLTGFEDDVVDRIVDRATTPTVRRTDPIETVLDLEAGDRPVTVSVAPVSRSDDRVVCVVRDATERAHVASATASLRAALRELRDATTRLEVEQRAVGACADVLDADLGVVYRVDEDAFHPTTVAPAPADAPASLPSLPRDDPILETALERRDASIYPIAELESTLERMGVRAEYDDVVAMVPIAGTGLAVLTASQPVPERLRAILDALATAAATAVDRLDRESTLRERDHALARARDELDDLEGLVDCRRRIDRALVRADTRAELERAVCEAFVSIDWIAFSWIGDLQAAAEEVSPRAWASDRRLERSQSHEGDRESTLDDEIPNEPDANDDYRAYLDRVTVALDAERVEPTGRTAASRRPTYVPRVADEEPSLEWRTEALERGFRSILSVPLIYDDYVYGALSLYADRPAAFDDRVREIVAQLGELVAASINAVDTKHALHTDSVTQLEFAIDGSETRDPLVSLARATGARLSIETAVPRPGDRSTLFVNASGTTPDGIRSAAESLEGVESARVISERDGRVLAELGTGPTLASVVVDHGGVVRTVDVDDGTRIVVELPQGTDVRAFVHMIERKYPGTSLLARRERDRTVQSREDVRSILEERLTDRQLRALETAYYSGFFEWPRERTGEEVAESLGVSQPTFNRHFRTAERKVYTVLFDEL